MVLCGRPLNRPSCTVGLWTEPPTCGISHELGKPPIRAEAAAAYRSNIERLSSSEELTDGRPNGQRQDHSNAAPIDVSTSPALLPAGRTGTRWRLVGGVLWQREHRLDDDLDGGDDDHLDGGDDDLDGGDHDDFDDCCFGDDDDLGGDDDHLNVVAVDKRLGDLHG